jgi:hypothetical protein
VRDLPDPDAPRRIAGTQLEDLQTKALAGLRPLAGGAQLGLEADRWPR